MTKIRSRPQEIIRDARCQNSKCKCARPTAVARLFHDGAMKNLCRDCVDGEMYRREMAENRRQQSRQRETV